MRHVWGHEELLHGLAVSLQLDAPNLARIVVGFQKQHLLLDLACIVDSSRAKHSGIKGHVHLGQLSPVMRRGRLLKVRYAELHAVPALVELSLVGDLI
jgi:hypothetical protein